MALTGSTTEQQIWNYLLNKLSNPYGVAGIMGNMYAESGLQSNNLQNSYEKKLGYTDTSYTSAVDKGVYTNFVYDSAGYGLVQWTYWSLKRDLLAYAQANNKSIGDLEMQLEFLCKQLSSGYSAVWNTCKNATSVAEASNAMLLKFERPADQSAAVQSKRAGYGQTYYDKYANKAATTTTATTQQQSTGGTSSMSVTIGHASIDENGKATGGSAGDQTGREVCTRTWYNKPWLKVFRPTASATAEKIAKAMEQACANDHIGYDQSGRTTLYTLAKAANWDLSKITTNCETDCSALVAVCVNAAGITVSKDMYTGSEETILMNTGKFTRMTDSIIVNSSDYLQRGDILLGSGHTAIVLSNGSKSNNAKTEAAAAGNTSYSGKGIGTAVAQTAMNIRNGAGTQYQVLSTIKSGTAVEVLEILSSGWYKIVWPGASCGYAYASNSTGKYFKYTAKTTTTQTTASTPTVVNYLVKITASALNIRKGPGVTYGVVGCIRDKGTYTIVKESNGWGYLKSGAGWISLAYTQKR